MEEPARNDEKIITNSEMQILEQLAVIDHRLASVEALKKTEGGAGKKKGGPTATEWFLIGGLILIAAISAITGLGNELEKTFNGVEANTAGEQRR
jgi:Flp pilus assembly pilin Flp